MRLRAALALLLCLLAAPAAAQQYTVNERLGKKLVKAQELMSEERFPEAAAILAQVNGWMTPDGVEAGALDVAGYLARLEREPLPLNVGTLVPHGPVRISVMGLAGGAPDAGDQQIVGLREVRQRRLGQVNFQR